MAARSIYEGIDAPFWCSHTLFANVFFFWNYFSLRRINAQHGETRLDRGVPLHILPKVSRAYQAESKQHMPQHLGRHDAKGSGRM